MNNSTYSGSLIEDLMETAKAAEHPCTCPPGYFQREKVHSPSCERRIANQEEANRNAMGNFNAGAGE